MNYNRGISDRERFFFFFLVFTFTARQALAVHLVLLGDSVDRQSSIEWCEWRRRIGCNVSSSEWGTGTLRYHNKHGRMATFYCKCNEDSVAYVHIFGSNATGPYVNHMGNNPLDPFEDTQRRITESLGIYVRLYGNPNRICFHSALWDVQYLRRSKLSIDATYSRLTLWSRLIDIFQIFNDTRVDVGIRTAVWFAELGGMLDLYNNEIRRLAAFKNLTFYDMDNDVWSSVGFDRSKERFLFRDAIHPKQLYTARAAAKMMGTLFSNSFLFGQNQNEPEAVVYRDLAGVTYFANIENRSFHPCAFNRNCSNLFKALRLGPEDIRNVPTIDTMNAFTMGESIKEYLFEDRVVFNITLPAAGLFYFVSSTFRPLQSVALLRGLCKTLSDVVEIQARDAFWFSNVALGAPIPDVFSKAELLVRFTSSRQIYLMKGGVFYSISGIQEILELNKTFSDVVVLSNEDAELLRHKPWPSSIKF